MHMAARQHGVDLKQAQHSDVPVSHFHPETPQEIYSENDSLWMRGCPTSQWEFKRSGTPYSWIYAFVLNVECRLRGFPFVWLTYGFPSVIAILQSSLNNGISGMLPFRFVYLPSMIFTGVIVGQPLTDLRKKWVTMGLSLSNEKARNLWEVEK